MATAIFGRDGRPVAAISVSGPTTRDLHGDSHELGALLGRHAAEISAVLRHAAAAA